MNYTYTLAYSGGNYRLNFTAPAGQYSFDGIVSLSPASEVNMAKRLIVLRNRDTDWEATVYVATKKLAYTVSGNVTYSFTSWFHFDVNVYKKGTYNMMLPSGSSIEAFPYSGGTFLSSGFGDEETPMTCFSDVNGSNLTITFVKVPDSFEFCWKYFTCL